MAFTAATLPAAIRWLFEVNNYEVEGPVKINGSEFDLVATYQTGLSQHRVYIEATVQYVDTAKYGKDLTKLSQIRLEPNAEALIVSSTGFTPDVVERAPAAGVLLLTYEQLFQRFERTQPYVDKVRRDEDLGRLARVYEQPLFQGSAGLATEILNEWVLEEDGATRWLVVVGEYGTGKTALMRMLQYEWTVGYLERRVPRLPFLIQLRDFTRQFDARGLIHRFADSNGLGHIPVEFLEAMIAEGRVVLLLDGYDEMAQYLNTRERRACLESLAELSRGGARGILTSRPNYFTEAEELRVFEVLYNGAASRSVLLGEDLMRQELAIDQMIESFILNRNEQRLLDLTPEQTEHLVSRYLADDPEGRAVVLGLLQRVFSAESGGDERSLSGKPVIVTYLLEVVEELKKHEGDVTSEPLSEWQIFSLIVRNLMRRDYLRTQNVSMDERLAFLQLLALELTRSEKKALNEDDFRALVFEEFRVLIGRQAADGQENPGEALFEDLRSSSTLTRTSLGRVFGWSFSHNSLREFLIVQLLIDRHLQGNPVKWWLPITTPMTSFAGACPTALMDSIADAIASNWSAGSDLRPQSQMLTLIWPGLMRRNQGMPKRRLLERIFGSALACGAVSLRHLDFSGSESAAADLSEFSASEAELIGIDFRHSDLSRANFKGAALDSCELAHVNLESADLRNSILLDCDLSGARLLSADFRGMDAESTSYIKDGDGVKVLEGDDLLGYLGHHGAVVDVVDPYHLYQWHEDFSVIVKIGRNLIDVTWGQRRGLEQRGDSRKNVKLARAFVTFLLRSGLAEPRGNSDAMIGLTSSGRAVLSKLVDDRSVVPPLTEFLAAEMS